MPPTSARADAARIHGIGMLFDDSGIFRLKPEIESMNMVNWCN